MQYDQAEVALPTSEAFIGEMEMRRLLHFHVGVDCSFNYYHSTVLGGKQKHFTPQGSKDKINKKYSRTTMTTSLLSGCKEEKHTKYGTLPLAKYLGYVNKGNQERSNVIPRPCL